MADSHKDEKRADPALAQYVVNLTPSEYEAHLKASKEPPTPRLQMEMGGSGTAKVHFHDAAGGEVAVTSAEWSSTGPVTVTPDEADPLSAALAPTGIGPATVTATGHAETGSAQAHAEVMVIEKIGAPIDGEIEITVAPPGPPPDPPAGDSPARAKRAELNEMTKEELMTVAHQRGAEVNQSWTKADIIEAIVHHR